MTRFTTLIYAEGAGSSLLLIHFIIMRQICKVGPWGYILSCGNGTESNYAIILVLTRLPDQVCLPTLVMIAKKNRPSGLKPQPRRRWYCREPQSDTLAHSDPVGDAKICHGVSTASLSTTWCFFVPIKSTVVIVYWRRLGGPQLPENSALVRAELCKWYFLVPNKVPDRE